MLLSTSNVAVVQHHAGPALPLIVYNIQRTRVYTARDRGYVNSCTAVLDVHVYACVGGTRAFKKCPAHDVRESPAFHEKSRWLYSFPWFEQNPNRVLVVPVPVPIPRVFQQGRTRYQGILPRAWYRTYESVGYGYGCRTELTKVSGTGMDVVPNLPKGRVWV